MASLCHNELRAATENLKSDDFVNEHHYQTNADPTYITPNRISINNNSLIIHVFIEENLLHLKSNDSARAI